MAVRTLNGSTDDIRFPSPNITGAVTYAALIKRAANSNEDALLIQHTSANAVAGGFDIVAAGNQLTIGDASQAPTSTLTVTTTDGWVIVVGVKAAGTVIPRLHKFPLAAGTWTRADADGTTANPSASSGGTLRFGDFGGQGSAKFGGSVAVGAMWSVALSDAEVSALATNLRTSDWYAVQTANLQFLADFNQASTATAVPDLSGNGRNQTQVSGTSVTTTDDPPGWAFGLASGTTQFTATITDDELVAAGAVEGNNLLKVFVKDAAGNWST